MFQIRAARMTDIAVLREIFVKAALSNAGDRELLLANPDALELSSASVGEGRTRVAVAAGDQPVGFATTVESEGAVEIEDLFVHPDWMRRGIGQALVHDVVVGARKLGVGRVEVTANNHALGFYTRVGFVFDREVGTRFRPAPRMHVDVQDQVADK